MIITSHQNPKVKALLKLRKRKERDALGVVLIEGYREILRARDGGIEFNEVYFSPEHFLGENEKALIDSLNVDVTQVAPFIFEKLSYRDRPDGLVAVAKQKRFGVDALENLLKDKKNPFLIIAEKIEKPGNLGSILRSSDAAGVDALIVADPHTDIYNPNVIRSSVGTLFTQLVIEGTSNDVLEVLKKHGVNVLSATPSAHDVYTDVDMTGPVAIAVGTEQLGLSDFWLEKCEKQVKIPMLGKADSLNVAAATTLLLYEVVRQRSL